MISLVSWIGMYEVVGNFWKMWWNAYYDMKWYELTWAWYKLVMYETLIYESYKYIWNIGYPTNDLGQSRA